MQQRIPTCHPERKHVAKGLCRACYEYQYYHSSNGWDAHTRYRTSLKGRSTRTLYAKSEPGKAAITKYRKSSKGQVAERKKIARYQASEKGRRANARNNTRWRSYKLGGFTFRYPGDFATICSMYASRCVYCCKAVLKLTEDHIIPLSKGGDDAWWNLVPACRSCNAQKHNRIWQPQLTPIQQVA